MNPLEKLIAFVSPQTALNRAEARSALQRKYAGAKNNHWSSFAGANSGSMNSNIDSSWGALTARTRQLVRDFPSFDGAVNNMEAFIVGDGLRFQSLILRPDGTPDRNLSRIIEDKFADWASSSKVDQSETMNFVEMQQFCVRSKAECGDGIFEKSVDPEDKTLRLRTIDPATLTDLGWGTKTVADNGLWFGIEYDRKTLRKKAYHFTPHADYGSLGGSIPDTYRIDAKNILHNYRVKGADQLRGVSAFASSIMLANAIRDYIQAELATQKAHSKWTAFVTTPSVGPGGSWNKATYDEMRGRYLEGLEYATMEILSPGQQVTLNSVQRSPEAVEKFSGQILRMCASSLGVPYEILNGDYREMNFSALNTVRRDFAVQLKPQWQSLIAHFNRPVFEAWLDLAVLRGDIEIPDYFQRRSTYTRGLWIPPGIAPVDPVKDANANILLLKAGLLDPQTIIMNAGRDPDRVLNNIESWKKELEDRDLKEIYDAQIPPQIEMVDEKDAEDDIPPKKSKDN